MKCNIYYLTDETGIPKYVGATTQKLKSRLGTHLSVSKNNKTKKDKWILEKGRKNIKSILIEECDIENYSEREKYWIYEYNKNGELTNKDKGGTGVIVGWNHKEETKILISKKVSERNLDEDYKKLQSDSHKGIPMNEKAKKELSERMQGNKFAKRQHSEETKEKMSMIKKGKISYIPNEETKKKISETLKGNVPVNKGKPMSEEQKLKLKEAWISRKLKYGNPKFKKK